MEHQAFAQLLGNYGEFVGAIAVVVTLGYLAVQIRNQNKESRFAAMHEISVAHRDSVTAVVSGDLADIFVKASEDFEALSPADTLRVAAHMYRFFKVWEEAYFQYRAGRLEPRIWEPMTRQYAAYFTLAPFARTWELRSEFVDSEFRDFVNSLDRVEMRLVYAGRANRSDA